MAKQTITLALLGAGRIGLVHAQNIVNNPDCELAPVYDVHQPAAQSLADQYNTAVADIDNILSDNNINAVLIASSTDTHADLIQRSVAAGKKVFCEKPIDLSSDRARDCLLAIGKESDHVMLGFNRRFDPNFKALKSAFDAGEIGKGELLSITSFDPEPPPIDYVKVSGGLFRDMAIHDFDMACFIFGEAPVSVSATGSCLVDPDIGKQADIDTAVTTLTFSDGRLAVIKNSRRAAYGYDQRLELLGSDGLLSANNMLESTVSKSTATGVNNAKPEHFFLQRYCAAYQAELNHFVDVIKGRSTLLASAKDGLNALLIADAADESFRIKQNVAINYS